MIFFVKCFYSQESHDRFYTHFKIRHIEVKHSINLCVFQDTPILFILKERGWESLFTLQGVYHPLLIRMFYKNMHTVSLSRSF